MGRYLIKINTKRKTIDYSKIPRGWSISRINKARRSHFRGYKLVKANSKSAAMNRLLRRKGLRY